MGRKNLLDGLIGGELTAVNSSQGASRGNPALPASAPHLSTMSRGAVGAVGRSIEQLRAQSIVDLDTSLIDPSFVADRLDISEEHYRLLVSSIREHGQQVPILVRPHPQKEGRYQIAFGRRRLLAVIELGRKIRAIIKPLSDEELVIAQGQENSARKERGILERQTVPGMAETADQNCTNWRIHG